MDSLCQPQANFTDTVSFNPLKTIIATSAVRPDPNYGPPPELRRFQQVPLIDSNTAPGGYEASTNELINEELGIAYPIIDGIPNMIPQAARTTHQNKKQEETEQH
ncbi:Protein preY, mitochondrial [Fukomys damarensis]|uniref:Protein preY, mitochondrial n=1 Tax=Fukomys damarensis TaxID=885580 RepID=A0A091CP82_FUKDA|nr:Protein preY, mitochondrial [Fukomys damarensis]